MCILGYLFFKIIAMILPLKTIINELVQTYMVIITKLHFMVHCFMTVLEVTTSSI